MTSPFIVLFVLIGASTSSFQFIDLHRPLRAAVAIGVIWPLALAIYLFKGLMDCCEIAFGDEA